MERRELAHYNALTDKDTGSIGLQTAEGFYRFLSNKSPREAELFFRFMSETICNSARSVDWFDGAIRELAHYNASTDKDARSIGLTNG